TLGQIAAGVGLAQLDAVVRVLVAGDAGGHGRRLVDVVEPDRRNFVLAAEQRDFPPRPAKSRLGEVLVAGALRQLEADGVPVDGPVAVGAAEAGRVGRRHLVRPADAHLALVADDPVGGAAPAAVVVVWAAQPVLSRLVLQFARRVASGGVD